MSSLIFYTDATQIFVATDTLAVESSGAPMMFCSKAIYLPHLRTIIAGTGMGGFAGDWAMYVNNRMILEGIMNLDFHTPSTLRTRWESLQDEYTLPPESTTTIYHFGLSEEDRSVVAFAYRSTSDFASERLGFGFGVKPECEVPEGTNLMEMIPKMMTAQREIQSKVPSDSRIYIGGEAFAIHLNSEKCATFPVFEFPDRNQDMHAIFKRHAGAA